MDEQGDDRDSDEGPNDEEGFANVGFGGYVSVSKEGDLSGGWGAVVYIERKRRKRRSKE